MGASLKFMRSHISVKQINLIKYLKIMKSALVMTEELSKRGKMVESWILKFFLAITSHFFYFANNISL